MPFLKPESCRPCPFYGKSKYIVPDKLVPGRIAVVAQNPAQNEEQGKEIISYNYLNNRRYPQETQVLPQPLIGATGYQLKHTYWPLTHLKMNDVSKLNIIKCRPYNKNTLPDIRSKELRGAISHCMHTHFTLPQEVRYILSLGQISLWALTRQKSVIAWRGYALPYIDKTVDYVRLNELPQTSYYDPSHSDIVVMPTLHIASLYKGSYDSESGEEGSTSQQGGNKRYFHAVYSDFQKFGKLVRGEWPSKLPDIRWNVLPKAWPLISAFDTEYTPADALIRWSLTDSKGITYVVEAERSQPIAVPQKATVVGQNLLADIYHLSKVIDLSRLKTVEDTMLAHSVLWTGEPHSLDYILSIYGRLNRHKHLNDTGDVQTDVLYAGLDSYTTLMDAWKGMMQEFKRDPLSWEVYRTYAMPLLNIIPKAERKGIALDHIRLEKVKSIYEERLRSIRAKAQEITGKEGFNLGSHQQVSRFIETEG